MKHLSRWHSVTAGTATAAVAAGAFGLSSILTGPGAPPAPIELSASEQSGAAIGDEGSTVGLQSPTAPSVVSEASPASAASSSPASNDSADDAGPRVEVQQDQRVAPTPEVSRSTASTTPTAVQDGPSNSPASVSAASASADSVSASTSVDSPS